MIFKISVIVPVYNMEPFLSETLDSLVSQSFNEFEVIIINDGSTDGTQDIINNYCDIHENFRYIIQKNSGAAAAKNRGIKEAQGDYLAFLDGDDKFAPNALEKLFKYAQEKKADLVVGRTKTFNLFNSRYMHATVQLSKKEIIDPFDLALIWSFSQSNKLFSRKKVLELGSRFPGKKYAEDGIFVIDFAHRCDKIVGCPHDILFYRKRTFDESFSATQTVSREMIDDYLNSYNQVYSLSKKNFEHKYCKDTNIIEDYDLKIKYDNYLEKIRFKEVKLLLNQFYRLFWRMDERDIKYIKEIFSLLKSEIYPESLKNLSNEYQDIYINDLIDSKLEMAENPIITLVLSPSHISKSKLLLMVQSIYGQDLPAFEILIQNNLGDKLSSEIRRYENIHILHSDYKNFKNFALKHSKGKYILFLDDFTILGPNSLRNIINHGRNIDSDMICTSISRLKNKNVSNYPSQEWVYSYRNTLKSNKRSMFNYLDLYLSNKILKKEFLEEGGFEFSNEPSSDVKKLYDAAKFRKIPGKYLFTDKKEDEIIAYLKTRNKLVLLKTKLLLLLSHVLYIGLRFKRAIQRQKLKKKMKLKFKNHYLIIKDIFKYRKKVSIIKSIYYSFKFGGRFLIGKRSEILLLPNAQVKINNNGCLKVGVDYGLPTGACLHIHHNGKLIVNGHASFMKDSSISIMANANLEIGNGSYINEQARVNVRKHLHIGDKTFIAWRCNIVDSDVHYHGELCLDLDTLSDEHITQEIHIGNQVWVGGGCTILKGVKIGDGAVIGAGSVLTRNIPPKSLAVGNPCRVIKKNYHWKP